MGAENRSQQLGNYRLIKHLGRGGFSDVYLGEHVYLKTQAAIKVLRTHLASKDVETFRTEALTIAHLVHPHIVRVLDFAVENYVPFLIMEYAPNGNLRQRHPAGTRVPPATFLPYVRQIASALQYAHDRRLIHRDVKPENMLVGANNETLLSDFGSVLVAQNSLSQSTEDTVIGTLSYMAPEQLQGKARPASDQYALAVVVYEWLSGKKPFNGSYMEIVAQHLSAAPPPLNDPSLAVPQAVQQVLQRTLAKDPRQRFPRVQDFADALERAHQVGQQQPALLQVPSPAANRPLPDAATQQATMPVAAPFKVQRPVTVPPVRAVSDPVRKITHVLTRGAGILVSIVVLGGLLLCGLGFAGFHYFTAQNTSAPSADTAGAIALANDFVRAISERNYDQAYNDLGSSMTSQTTRSKFKQQAQSEDQCYGNITGDRSSGTTSRGNTLNYSYTMTRAKLQKPYQLQLTLQQNSSGNWQITAYNSDMSSVQPTCP